jgi:hypothetical protein
MSRNKVLVVGDEVVRYAIRDSLQARGFAQHGQRLVDALVVNIGRDKRARAVVFRDQVVAIVDIDGHARRRILLDTPAERVVLERDHAAWLS